MKEENLFFPPSLTWYIPVVTTVKKNGTLYSFVI